MMMNMANIKQGRSFPVYSDSPQKMILMKHLDCGYPKCVIFHFTGVLFFFCQATMLFVELQYTLATEEAERIGVDHVARMSTSDAGEGSSGNLHFIYRYSQCFTTGAFSKFGPQVFPVSNAMFTSKCTSCVLNQTP